MADLLFALILLAIVGGAVAYVVREKKKGTRCIGCPMAGKCSQARQGGCSGCHNQSQNV